MQMDCDAGNREAKSSKAPRVFKVPAVAWLFRDPNENAKSKRLKTSVYHDDGDDDDNFTFFLPTFGRSCVIGERARVDFWPTKSERARERERKKRRTDVISGSGGSSRVGSDAAAAYLLTRVRRAETRACAAGNPPGVYYSCEPASSRPTTTMRIPVLIILVNSAVLRLLYDHPSFNKSCFFYHPAFISLSLSLCAFFCFGFLNDDQ